MDCSNCNRNNRYCSVSSKCNVNYRNLNKHNKRSNQCGLHSNTNFWCVSRNKFPCDSYSESNAKCYYTNNIRLFRNSIYSESNKWLWKHCSIRNIIHMDSANSSWNYRNSCRNFGFEYFWYINEYNECTNNGELYHYACNINEFMFRNTIHSFSYCQPNTSNCKHNCNNL